VLFRHYFIITSGLGTAVMMQSQSKLIIMKTFTTFKSKAAAGIQNISQIQQQFADNTGTSHWSVKNIFKETN
jgi:hypothetical protein